MGCNPTRNHCACQAKGAPATVVRAWGLIRRSTATTYSFDISILLWSATTVKVWSDLGHNLVIRHLVGGFHTHDTSTEVGFIERLLQFPLCFAGAQYQNGLGTTNRCNDRIIVDVEMSRKPLLPAIVCRYLL